MASHYYTRREITKETIYALTEPHPDLFTQLTSHAWQSSIISEGYRYEWFADGTFRWKIVSDYTSERRGIWNWNQLSPDEGIIFLLSESDTNSVKFDTKRIAEVFTSNLQIHRQQ